MSGLAGAGIVVTRAEHQAGPLCELIRSRGGVPWCYPTLRIDPCRDPAALRAAVDPLERYDWAIFVSPNAVEHGLALLAPWPASLGLAAVGEGTAAKLGVALRRSVLAPRAGIGSEGLLAEPALAEIGGQRILIVRGRQGRELLAESLRRRGALVQYAAVYERRCPPLDRVRRDELERAWQRGRIDYVLVGSVEALTNLHTLLSPRGHAALARGVLVSASARVIKEGTEIGIERTLRAARPDDLALVDAIIDHRRQLP